MIIVGTAHRMPVAIGGMAVAGAGAGLSELIGAAGVAELAPVKSRGKYIGTIFLLILPFAASAAYGAHPLKLELADGFSTIIFSIVDMEMGRLDFCHYQRGNLWPVTSFLLASTSCQLRGFDKATNPRSY